MPVVGEERRERRIVRGLPKGVANLNVRALSTRDSTLEKQEVPPSINFTEEEGVNGCPLISHVPGELLAPENSADALSAYGAWLPVHLRRPMARPLAAKPVSLDGPGESLPLALSRNVHILPRNEVLSRQCGSSWKQCILRDPELSNTVPRWGPCLFEVLQLRSWCSLWLPVPRP